MDVITLTDESGTFHFEVIARITNEEEGSTYLYIQKINYDESPLFVKEVKSDDSIVYEEVEEDEEYIRLEEALNEAIQ